MIKLTALLTSRPELSHAQFVDRYENHHAPLIVDLIPHFQKYRRNFLLQSLNAPHIAAHPIPDVPFHAITEMWYPDTAAIEAQTRAIAGSAGQIIAEDERRIFDRSRLCMFASEERVTEPERLKARPSACVGQPRFKLSGLLRKSEHLSDTQFRHYYEARHVELALQLMRRAGEPIFAAYSRSYVQSDQIMPIGDPPGLVVDFDVITDIGFWTREDLDAFLALAGDPTVSRILAEDEARLFDRDNVRSFLIDERETDPADIGGAQAAYPTEKR